MIGPSLPPSMGSVCDVVAVGPQLLAKSKLSKTQDVLNGDSEVIRQHCRGVPTTSQRLDAIGPAAMPPAGQSLLGQEVHTKTNVKVKGPTMPAATSEVAAVDKAVVVACRSGELPERNWSAKWSVATKQAALLAALETAQMHVVYALRPHSLMFQENLSSANLEQAELDRLLRSHALGKFKVKKPAAQEAIVWLIEAGADIELLCCDVDFSARAAAARILSAMNQDGLAQCVKLLRSDDWRGRATAVEALGFRTDDAVAHISTLADLLADDEALVRTAAINTLAKIGASAAGRCADLLKSDRPRAREAAIEVLGRIGPAASDHAEAIAELLQDNDWQVPTAAANALQKIGGLAAQYCADVVTRSEPLAMVAAVEALIRVGGVQAADAAAGLARNEDSKVRRHAAEALGQLGQDASGHAELLSEMCNDVDKEVRIAARSAQGKLGIRVELPPLFGNGDNLPNFIAKGKGKGKGRIRHEESDERASDAVGNEVASRNNTGADTRHHDRAGQRLGENKMNRRSRSRNVRSRSCRHNRSRSRDRRSRSCQRHERRRESERKRSQSRQEKHRGDKRGSTKRRSKSRKLESRKKKKCSRDSSSS